MFRSLSRRPNYSNKAQRRLSACLRSHLLLGCIGHWLHSRDRAALLDLRECSYFAEHSSDPRHAYSRPNPELRGRLQLRDRRYRDIASPIQTWHRPPCGKTARPLRIVRRAPNTQSLGGCLQFGRSEEHTSELQSRQYLVCRLLLEKKK